MKKLVSMLLALVLCLCALTPVMAETAVEAFPYTVEGYRTYFDVLAVSMFGVSPAWTLSADGRSYNVDVPGYGTVEVALNAQGQITSFKSTLVATEDNVTTTSNAFGQLVALIALSSKAAEDITFLTEENINQFTAELQGLLGEMLSRIAEAMEGPLVVSGEVVGNTCSFSMLLDLNNMTINFGFIFQP